MTDLYQQAEEFARRAKETKVIQQAQIQAERKAAETVMPADIAMAIDSMIPPNLPDEAEIERMRREKDEKRRHDEAEKRMKAADLPARQSKRAISGAVDSCGRFGEILSRGIAKLGRGVIMAILGSRGSGKTQLAVCIAHAAITGGKSALYLTAFDFFLLVRETFRKDAKKSERDIIAELSSPYLLILDELQERGETPWEDRLLTALIDRRYREGKDTLLISNQQADEFRASVGASVEDRLREGGGIAILDGTSRRKSEG